MISLSSCIVPSPITISTMSLLFAARMSRSGALPLLGPCLYDVTRMPKALAVVFEQPIQSGFHHFVAEYITAEFTHAGLVSRFLFQLRLAPASDCNALLGSGQPSPCLTPPGSTPMRRRGSRRCFAAVASSAAYISYWGCAHGNGR